MSNIIEFKNQKFEIVNDPNILSSEHCDYCDFKEMCDEYLEHEDWFPCGATFHSNQKYLKNIKE